MNKGRRKEIAKAAAMLAEARGLLEEANAKAAEAIEMLETAKDEEQEYKDNMPENMRDGEKGQMAESAVDNLENAGSSATEGNDEIESAINDIQEIIDKLESDTDSNLEQAENYAEEAAA